MTSEFTITREQIAGVVPRRNDWISGLLRALEFRLNPDKAGQVRFYRLVDIVAALRERGIGEEIVDQLMSGTKEHADAQ
ncbi:hypothetical protein E2K80_04765 [Rhodophyticola sp. CCM32]|uniref:hypothetical protein n=1 Tax=Rhodophyticola sp. CCM32 TaxID=2916397 RepID=UPI00107F167D|nr:hypothetical protein [Rhodophyticola sp. CCM32]QBY00134.1 hypothetical protein E2K80_04765 [Rhodophyticola sp. CCM32]